MSWSDYPIVGSEIAKARKRFQHTLLIIKPASMTHSVLYTYMPYTLSALSALYINIHLYRYLYNIYIVLYYMIYNYVM